MLSLSAMAAIAVAQSPPPPCTFSTVESEIAGVQNACCFDASGGVTQVNIGRKRAPACVYKVIEHCSEGCAATFLSFWERCDVVIQTNNPESDPAAVNMHGLDGEWGRRVAAECMQFNTGDFENGVAPPPPEIFDPTVLHDTIATDHAEEADGCGWADVMDIALACDTGGATGFWSPDFCGSDCHGLLAPFYAKCSHDLEEGQASLLSTGIYALSQCDSTTPAAPTSIPTGAIPAVGAATAAQCGLLSMNVVLDIDRLCCGGHGKCNINFRLPMSCPAPCAELYLPFHARCSAQLHGAGGRLPPDPGPGHGCGHNCAHNLNLELHEKCAATMHIAVDADGNVSDGTDEGTIGEGR